MSPRPALAKNNWKYKKPARRAARIDVKILSNHNQICLTKSRKADIMTLQNIVVYLLTVSLPICLGRAELRGFCFLLGVL
jgi:hypothetical protein